MINYGCKYINCLIRFDYYNTSHYALCVACEPDKKIVCYRVKEKNTVKSSAEMIVKDEQENNLNYVVDCRCKFSIPAGCVRKEILHCNQAFVDRANQCHNSLDSLDVIIKKYNALKHQYYHMSADEAGVTSAVINNLAEEIYARKTDFLQKRPSKKKKVGKYGNYKQLPNKNGISRVYSGGGCSSK